MWKFSVFPKLLAEKTIMLWLKNENMFVRHAAD